MDAIPFETFRETVNNMAAIQADKDATIADLRDRLDGNEITINALRSYGLELEDLARLQNAELVEKKKYILQLEHRLLGSA